MSAAAIHLLHTRERWVVVGICVAIAALVWLVFGQTLNHRFINYDDDTYLHHTPQVRQGLSWSGMQWAFTSVHAGNWHPLTTLTHMLDCELYGLEPRGHHFTNVLLHSATAVLLFLLLRRMTGALWCSAFVAAVFAIHPLRVESVAWVAERKDVLSGLFFVLTLAAYRWYANRPAIHRYLLVVVVFACGLMSKQMLVTVPLLLLLLDLWPLRRKENITRLAAEKLPLLAMSAAASAVTLIVQRGTMSSLEQLPFFSRLGNAATAVFIYIRQMVWPFDLAPFYPHPREQLSVWIAVACAAGVVVMSVVALLVRRSRPYVPVGWFWYLGMLVPVIGIVQVGLQAHADRYTYLPQIGLTIAITCAAAELLRVRFFLPVLGVAIIGLLGWRAWEQTRVWRDSETLWRHTLSVTENNVVAHTSLANVLPGADAIPHYEAALQLAPTSIYPLNNLAWVLATHPESIFRDGRRAVELAARADQLLGGAEPAITRTLAAALAEAGQFRSAIETAERALLAARAQGNEPLAFDLENNLAGYEQRQPVRDPSLLEKQLRP
jgi:protein O-mannosyl-transferase